MNLKQSMSASQKPSDNNSSDWSHVPTYSDIDWSKLELNQKVETIKIPVFVGYYQLGGIYGLRIAFENKPCWFHRKMMKLCLGWVWVDGKL